MGLVEDNRSGLHGLLENPATLADSRHKFDLNLSSISAFVDNDYATINALDLLKSDFDFDKNTEYEILDDNNAFAQIEVLGPSVMFSMGAKNSLAIFTRVRSYVNADRINGRTFDIIKDGFKLTNNYSIEEGFANVSAHVWGEAGISISSVLFDSGAHMLKGGISAKYLIGGGAANGSSDKLNLTYSYDDNANPKTKLTTNGVLAYSYTDRFEKLDDFKNIDLNVKDKGWGVDFGFVYEYRPNHKKYSYTAASGKTKMVRNANKYALRLSASITDYGKIDYVDGIKNTYNLDNVSVNENDYDSDQTISQNLDRLLNKTNSEKKLSISLPTALRVNMDLRASKNLYFNFRTVQSLVDEKTVGNEIPTFYTVTPRLEGKYFSAYFPQSYFKYSGFQSGFGLRLGFFHIGSSTVVTNLLQKTKSANLYAGIKIPIAQSKTKKHSFDIEELPSTSVK